MRSQDPAGPDQLRIALGLGEVAEEQDAQLRPAKSLRSRSPQPRLRHQVLRNAVGDHVNPGSRHQSVELVPEGFVQHDGCVQALQAPSDQVPAQGIEPPVHGPEARAVEVGHDPGAGAPGHPGQHRVPHGAGRELGQVKVEETRVPRPDLRSHGSERRHVGGQLVEGEAPRGVEP